MTKKHLLIEQSVLFISIVKWFFLASCVGVIVGASTYVFVEILNYCTTYTGQFKYYFLLLPFALFLSSLIIRRFAPEAKGHGTEKVIEAVHKFKGRINPGTVPVKLLATVITIAAGGSVGKEGPAAQIGAGLSSIFGDIFRFNKKDKRVLIICGISAGFSSIFGTPIAGALFGVEVLFVGTMFYDVMFPSFVAGIISYQVSSYLGVTYFHSAIEFVPHFSEGLFIKVILGAVFFGLCSLLLIETMKWMEKASSKINIWEPYKGLIGGSILVLLVFLTSTRYLGLGLDTIHSALDGSTTYTYEFLIKILFTCITLAFCGSGGVVTPIFFIGATAGSAFGILMGLDPALFASIGMVSLLAGAANTPISASIMAIEFFGPEIAPYAAISCIVSYVMTGHRSVYPSQVIDTTKSPSIFIERGIAMENLTSVRIRRRPRSMTDVLIRIADRIQKIIMVFKKK